MRKFAVIIAVLLLAAVLVSGCQSKQGTNGYATYSGNSPAPSGGGGCGRFAGAGADSCAEYEDVQDAGAGFSNQL
ncbi:hypothetical protein HYY72_03790 [Candidatus Woesearchaeota archaeon]|nr:hypothetical protein [Candidatus Woesearchaeota archaeon]